MRLGLLASVWSTHLMTARLLGLHNIHRPSDGLTLAARLVARQSQHQLVVCVPCCCCRVPCCCPGLQQINAEKAPYLTDKLKVWMLPTLALIKGEKVVDYVVGFDDLGGKDDFSTGVCAGCAVGGCVGGWLAAVCGDRAAHPAVVRIARAVVCENGPLEGLVCLAGRQCFLQGQARRKRAFGNPMAR